MNIPGTLQKEALLLSPDFLVYAPTSIAGFDYKKPPPKQFLTAYKKAVHELKSHYFFLADEFHRQFPPPFETEDIANFLTEEFGIEFEVLGTCFPGHIAGCLKWENTENKKVCLVYVNITHPSVRCRFTIVHEMIHALQEYDYSFHAKLAEYPKEIHTHIAEKIADKTAAEFLLPCRFQTRGLFGARDVHKKILNVPLPRFDEENSDHVLIARSGEKCAIKVSDYIKTYDSSLRLGRLRLDIRKILTKDLIEIDKLLKKIL